MILLAINTRRHLNNLCQESLCLHFILWILTLCVVHAEERPFSVEVRSGQKVTSRVSVPLKENNLYICNITKIKKKVDASWHGIEAYNEFCV